MVSQQFDKHLYLRYLNSHNHNTCTHLLQNRLYRKRDSILFYLSTSLNTSSTTTIATDAMVINHHNNRLKCNFHDHSYRQSITLLLLVILLEKIYLFGSVWVCLGLFGNKPIITTKNKTKPYLKISLPAPMCPQPRFRAQDLHGL